MAMIPSFSQPPGATAPSSAPSVTQLSAESSAAAASPVSDRRNTQARTNSTTAPIATGGRAPWLIQPRAAAASGGTATSAR